MEEYQYFKYIYLLYFTYSRKYELILALLGYYQTNIKAGTITTDTKMLEW